MMTIVTVCGLLLLIGGGLCWAVRVGKKMNRLEQMEKGQEVVKDLNKFNKEVDQETKSKIANNINPVRGPWLR